MGVAKGRREAVAHLNQIDGLKISFGVTNESNVNTFWALIKLKAVLPETDV